MQLDKSVDTSVDFCGVTFRNPLVPLSGTFGYGIEYAEDFDLAILGGFIIKAITLLQRQGNLPPRIFKTTSGMLNSIGLQNIGLEEFIRKILPSLIEIGKTTNVIYNISGSKINEYCEVVTRLRDYVKFFEINISCPNVEGEGMLFGQDPKMAFAITEAVKKVAGEAKIIVKLPPQVTDITVIAKAVESAGADAISLINTVPGMRINPENGEFQLANKVGGLSGPAIFPIAVRNVYLAAQAVKIPIIGQGGVSTAANVVEMLRAGATLVGVGTKIFSDVDDLAMPRLLEDFIIYCQMHQFFKVSDLIGKHAK